MIYSYVLEFTTCAVQGVTIIFSFFYPTGKAGGAQILRYQGIAVNYYGFTLGALALNPSDFCNATVNNLDRVEITNFEHQISNKSQTTTSKS